MKAIMVIIRIPVIIVCLYTSHLPAVEVVLDTPQGKLRGGITAAGDVAVFKGIPYAIPPLGVRRWQPAAAAPPWIGMRPAQTFGPDCIQPLSMQAFHAGMFLDHPPALTSEDCLYLNVWTPRTDEGELVRNLPVMVWIHGGGLVSGSGSWPLYDGTELARNGVVLVTFNYRLGIFGNFAHPELTAESPHHASGNYNITDQIQVLKWVRNNISAFGGDPGNVTIFGESGGAGAVSALMASPLAAGLFHRAIAESGTGFTTISHLTLTRTGKASAESMSLEFTRITGCETLQCLRDMPATELLQAEVQRRYSYSNQMVVDGWVLPDQIYDIFARGAQQDVPVIIGFNSHEGYRMDEIWGGYPVPANKAAYIKEINEKYGDLAAEYLSIYPYKEGQNPFLQLYGGRYSTFGWAMEAWARMMGKVSSNAYLYYFGHIPPGVDGAFHTAEISYVFNNEKYSVRYSPNIPVAAPHESDLKLADEMSDYWVAFAQTGAPAVNGLPEWEPYTDTARYYMEFKEGEARLLKDLFPGVWEIQYKIITKLRNSGRF